MPAVNHHFAKEALGSGGWMGALLNLLKNIPELEIGVVTACHQFPESQFRDDGVDYFIINQKSNRFRRSLFPVDNKSIYVKKCVNIVNKYKPDVIHVHGTERFYAKMLHQNLVQCPVVISIQGIMSSYSEWYRWFGKLSILNILKITWRDSLKFSGLLWDLRVAKQQAKRERHFFQNGKYFFGRTDWDKNYLNYYNKKARYFKISRVLRNPFWNHQWSLKDCKRHRIIFTNTRHPRKGTEILLDAVENLKPVYPDVELILVGSLGSGGYGKYIKRRIDKLDGTVISRGQLDANEIAKELCNAHVFVSASYIDNSPNSIAEAQLVGIPVISSYTGGTPSMVQEGKTGLLFPTDDVPLLMSKIQTLFENDLLAKTLGENASKLAHNRHNPKNIVKAQLAAYKNIVNKATK